VGQFSEARATYPASAPHPRLERPYIIDFGPLVSEFPIASLSALAAANRQDSTRSPYTLLIQVALAHLESNFDGVTGADRPGFTAFIDAIFDGARDRGGLPFFEHHSPKKNYGLAPGWVSAMTQGQALSLAVRLDQCGLFAGREAMIDGLMRSLTVPVGAGGVMHGAPGADFWLEEYPSDPASFVLNGYMFAIAGVHDYALSRHGNPEAAALWDECVRALERRLAEFDIRGWSRYDLVKGNFAPVEYHLIHIYGLRYLHEVSGVAAFGHMAQRWHDTFLRTNVRLVHLAMKARAGLRRMFLWRGARSW
jgi:hypothetical protein